VRITRPSRRLVSICCWTSWISVRISARRSRGCCGVFSGCRRWLGLRLGMVVPLATGVSENDDYQRACGRRETPLQGTDSFGSLPFSAQVNEKSEVMSIFLLTFVGRNYRLNHILKQELRPL